MSVTHPRVIGNPSEIARLLRSRGQMPATGVFSTFSHQGEAWCSRLDDIFLNAFKYPQHVRSLSLNVGVLIPRYRLSEAFAHLRGMCPFFPHLKRLEPSYGTFPLEFQFGAVLASQNTLRRLVLKRCYISIGTLATPINNFPNLSHLELIDTLLHEAGNEPVPPLSRPLRKLSVSEPDFNRSPCVVDWLLGLRPRCVEVTIRGWVHTPLPLTQRIIINVSRTAELLALKVVSESKRKVRIPLRDLIKGTRH